MVFAPHLRDLWLPREKVCISNTPTWAQWKIASMKLVGHEFHSEEYLHFLGLCLLNSKEKT